MEAVLDHLLLDGHLDLVHELLLAGVRIAVLQLLLLLLQHKTHPVDLIAPKGSRNYCIVHTVRLFVHGVEF